MKRLLTAPLLALLTACGVSAPPRDTGQWTATVHGVSITYRLNQAQSIGGWSGMAHTVLGGQACVIDVEVTTRAQLTRTVAHEAGHCLQAAFLLPGISRADIAPYFADPKEGFAESYARQYLEACGDSLKPLGWADYNVPTCAEAPDPRTVTGGHVKPLTSVLAALTLVAGTAPGLAALVLTPAPLCRVVATVTPAPIRGTYNVKVSTRPECPPNGYALIRAESGRIYPWQRVTPGNPVTLRGIAWWWHLTWRAASGKLYAIPTPGMKAPWGTP